MTDFEAARRFITCCLRFTTGVAARHARLASGWRAAPLPGGGRTRWIATRGFSSCHPPLQSFAWRDNRSVRLRNHRPLHSSPHPFPPEQSWPSSSQHHHAPSSREHARACPWSRSFHTREGSPLRHEVAPTCKLRASHPHRAARTDRGDLVSGGFDFAGDRTQQRRSARAESAQALPVRSRRTRGNAGSASASRRTRPHLAVAPTRMYLHMPLADEPSPLAADHFPRFATSRRAALIPTPGATNPKRRRNPTEYPSRAWERIFVAPLISPARSAPTAKTPHTSSPEKPDKSVPQHLRTDLAVSIGLRPRRRVNSRSPNESSDLRHAFASPELALGETLSIIGKLFGYRKIQATALRPPPTGLCEGIPGKGRGKPRSRYGWRWQLRGRVFTDIIGPCQAMRGPMITIVLAATATLVMISVRRPSRPRDSTIMLSGIPEAIQGAQA